MKRFLSLLREIKEDVPNSNFTLKIFLINYFFSPRFRILLNHRIGKYFSNSRFLIFRLVGSLYKVTLITKRNCDISYNSSIGKNLRLPHPIGIVIGDGVIIRDHVTIFQQVTLGSHGKKGESKEYPIIESGVKIFAGAKIIGGVTIGENSLIGANAVVLKDVPANYNAVGIPAKILPQKNR